MRVRELAELLEATYEGDGEHEIRGAAQLENAGTGELSFVGSRKALDAARASSAGCLLVSFDYDNHQQRTVIRTPQPRAAFALAVARLHPKPKPLPGIHPSAVLAHSAVIDPTCTIGPHVTIGERSSVGPGTVISAGTQIGADVSIGSDCVLYANVTVYDGTGIGSRCILHSGSVLGADGFGFAMMGDHYEKFPQIGRVVLGDDVEVGANSTVDRAALGTTWIGDGTKLDNMVHIGHNCRIGRHVVIAAQTGLSGAVEVGDYAVIGGQVGVGDKAKIESKAIIGSGAGILTSKIVHSGQVMWGTPARPLKEHLRQLAGVTRIEDMRQQIADLKSRLAEVESAIGSPASHPPGS